MENVSFEVVAAPIFLSLMFVEYCYSRYKNENVYSFGDSISSVMLGVLSSITGLLLGGTFFLIYLYFYDNYRIYDLTLDNLWLWFAVWLAFDFCAYILHWAEHRINLFWASHVVHHQSEEYNLTTALRQTSTGGYFVWFVFVPLAVLGVPPEMIFTAHLIHLAYQFWVHTKLIGNLGWFEKFFVTPSHHRVHHGCNPRYVDKNYGSTLIIWDKMFGTFQKEDEPVVYGITKPINSFNPLYANFHYYISIIKLIAEKRNLKGLCGALFLPPEWMDSRICSKESSKLPQVCYVGPRVRIYCVVQAIGHIVLGLWLIGYGANLSSFVVFSIAVYIWLSMIFIGGALTNEKYLKYDQIKYVFTFLSSILMILFFPVQLFDIWAWWAAFLLWSIISLLLVGSSVIGRKPTLKLNGQR